MDLEQLHDAAKKIQVKSIQVEKDSPIKFLPDDVCKKIDDLAGRDELIKTKTREEVNSIIYY